MKKRYVIIGLLASSLVSFGQKSDVGYRKRKISRTDIQVMMSFYTQENDHSAVTGGIGTENLQVYATQVSVDHQSDSIHTFHVDSGIDIISSASTDNIDMVKSSASRLDARTHLNGGYQRYFKRSGVSVGANAGLSVESDYTSIGAGLTLSHLNEDQSRQLSVTLQSYFDDLRWGRLHDGTPDKLIYPAELRDREWLSGHNRYSYNLELGWYTVINRRMTLGIYPGLSYQRGVLSTPFHRVYFADNSLRVESLPGSRLKVPVGVQLNTFIGGSLILRSNYRYYLDDFGIQAHTLSFESAWKMNPSLVLTPMIRVYHQRAADYFKSYATHDVNELHYTSDYDLSQFSSIKPGVSVRYSPPGGRAAYRSIELHYAFYHRNDGLNAHMATVVINLGYQRGM